MSIFNRKSLEIAKDRNMLSKNKRKKREITKI